MCREEPANRIILVASGRPVQSAFNFPAQPVQEGHQYQTITSRYIPALNAEHDPAVLHAFVEANPFAMLVTSSAAGIQPRRLVLRSQSIVSAMVARDPRNATPSSPCAFVLSMNQYRVAYGTTCAL